VQSSGSGIEIPQSVAQYLDQRISAAAWYPETDYVQLLHAYMKLAKLEKSWHRVGEQSARTSVRTVHRNVLREGDVEGTVAMMPVAWRSYHDTGTITVDVVSPGYAKVIIKGYVIRDADMCTMIRGYASRLGARFALEWPHAARVPPALERCACVFVVDRSMSGARSALTDCVLFERFPCGTSSRHDHVSAPQGKTTAITSARNVSGPRSL
jgi:hypothetical protein